MTNGSNRAYLKRWVTWLGVVVLVGVVLSCFVWSLYLNRGRGVTGANGHRIVAGMARAEVEAILGSPNPLPDVARKGEAFWDETPWFGWRYVAIHVVYDADGRVVSTDVSDQWRP
jgi:hypothetical protein